MNTTETESEKGRLPIWAAALIVALASTVALFFFDLGIQALTRPARSVVAHGFEAAIIAVSCWVLCRRKPSAIWYVVPLANVFELGRAVLDPSFWKWPVWLAIVLGWVVSAVAGALGRLRG